MRADKHRLTQMNSIDSGCTIHRELLTVDWIWRLTRQAELILVLLNREDAKGTKKEGRRLTVDCWLLAVVHGKPDARCPYRFYRQL